MEWIMENLFSFVIIAVVIVIAVFMVIRKIIIERKRKMIESKISKELKKRMDCFAPDNMYTQNDDGNED